MEARWSKSQTWSKPDSSAMRQTARRASMVVSCPESLRPKRSGWFTVRRLRVEASRPDADGHVVAVGKHLRRPAVALYPLAVLGDVLADAVGGRVVGEDLRHAIEAHDQVTGPVGVEMKLHVGIGLHIAHLLAGDRIDQKGMSVPPEPDRDGVRPPIGTDGREPDDDVVVQALLNALVRRDITRGHSA